MRSKFACENVRWQRGLVSRADREQLNGHQSVLLWFTGLSGSGKSTLAHAVEHQLYEREVRTFVLDGDNVRHGICRDLSFSPQDRTENIRRAGEVAKLFLEAGMISLTAFISPYRKDREFVRALVGQDNFIEIYCRCPLEECEARDVKGLYRRARLGEIKDFTGISAPYEEPQQPELILNTGKESIESCVTQVLRFLSERKVISSTARSAVLNKRSCSM